MRERPKHATSLPSFETRWMARVELGMTAVAAHTFSNGTSILLRFSSHSGTGRFFERMKSGLNSFD